jgi:EAL domain-containing protein (putative c-di-GMP-specific phosphodiesterase class I)
MPHSFNCLVVDDDPMFNIIAESVIATLCGGNVVTAGSGRAGLERLQQTAGEFAFVFLDLNMPDLDGLAFMRAAAKAGFRGRIVISSGEPQAILQSARNLGGLLGVRIAGAIRKPLKIEEVRAIFDAWQETTEDAAAGPKTIALHDDDYDLTPYYQPQYSLQTGAVLGFEALLRLQTRDGQVHGPSKLFDSLTDHSQLVDVSLKIAERVLADIRSWHAEGFRPQISINFDASVLEQPEVVSALQTMVADSGVDPRTLCLEVTERSLPSDLSMLVEALTRLRMAGFHLSLDDYGTGTSNFELLRLCPFSELKLDRKVVEAAVRDPITRRFMQSACHIARDLDIVTVAEGVENHAELGQVLAAEIAAVQGFLFSRPLPAAAIKGVANADVIRLQEESKATGT